MNPADPLSQLRSIHLPEPISWWPLAPGWWILIAISLVLITWLIFVTHQNYKKQLYRRQALLELKQITNIYTPEKQAQQAWLLLKQTVDSAYPDQNASALSLAELLSFLHKNCSKPVFSQADSPLGELLYARSSSIDQSTIEQFMADVTTWIKHHKKVVKC